MIRKRKISFAIKKAFTLLNLSFLSSKGVIILFALIFLFSKKGICQESNNLQNSILNFSEKDSILSKIDPLLYNGIIYKSSYPSNVTGNQYFLSPDFIKGSVTIKGIKYENVELNYDIYKQELLFKFTTLSNSSTVIMISKAWLEDFSLDKTYFKVYRNLQPQDRIYQSIGKDSTKILYYWKKDLKLNGTGNTSELFFSLKKEQNVLLGKTLKKYTNNRSFVRVFDKKKQAIIKNYLRQNRIRVNKASDIIMENLINYCNNI